GPRPVSAGSRSEAAARPVSAGPALAAGPAKTTRSARTKLRRAARAWSRGADDHAAIRIDADRLRLHAGGVLHREMHDPPLVGQHRLERHGLPAGFYAGSDAAGDLPKLLLTTPAIPLDVERNVHRAADPPRGDRRGDLLQRDQVLATAADE